MEKWIYELILSVITVAGTIIALGQTRQQMRLSNKQALFEKRLNTYMFVKGLMELCNSNKTHFREYRDDVCLTNKLIFGFLTNNSYLKELGDVINNSSDDNYRVKLLKKLEEIKSAATRIELIFRGKKRFFCSEFVSDYGEVLWRMYQYQIVCDKIEEERHKRKKELENLCGIYREPNYRKDVYDAMNKLVESYYKLEKVENKIRKQIVLK